LTLRRREDRLGRLAINPAGLLDDDVLSRLDRGDGDLFMHRVRHGDVDRFDIAILKDGAIVVRVSRALGNRSRNPPQRLFRPVAHRHDLRPPHRIDQFPPPRRHRGEVPPHHAAADDAKSNRSRAHPRHSLRPKCDPRNPGETGPMSRQAYRSSSFPPFHPTEPDDIDIEA
jgi:hypothetical protein